MKKLGKFLLYGGILFAISPIISVLIAGSIASFFDCELHEGFTNPCVLGGVDWGETLYFMAVLGWFALLTIPIGVVVALIGLGIGIVRWVIERRQKSSDSIAK